MDTASHMKTTINIPDSLFEEARRLAQREQITLKTLIEEGLRTAIANRSERPQFKLRKASFKGKGLCPGLEGFSWDQILDASYEGRGGDQ